MQILKDKIAIVTGSEGTGIGQGLAYGFAEAGADVVVCGKNPAAGEELAANIRAINRKALLLKVDVSDSAQVKDLVKTVMEEFNRIDILINNAAINLPGLVSEMKDKTWQRVIDTCLSGVFYCSREVLKPMIAQRSGKIVNISSYVADSVFKGMAPYCAAKAGINAFTKTLALEVAEYNINVNAIAPGFVYHKGLDGIVTEEQIIELQKKIPLTRVGEPRDILGTALLLTSDWGSYITGEIISVTGGLNIV
jgi:NAD(P)-dependent dehydrogenase (short-subunit alcohol dehydrogenase family)